MIVAFLSLANFIAAKVSAVSPDWEIAITTSFSLIIGFLYLNSEAYSTSTGILAISSKGIHPLNQRAMMSRKQQKLIGWHGLAFLQIF